MFQSFNKRRKIFIRQRSVASYHTNLANMLFLEIITKSKQVNVVEWLLRERLGFDFR